MPRYAPPPRRGYRDQPRNGAAGSVTVLLFGLILLAAAGAGGYIVHYKPDLLPFRDRPAVVDAAQVCELVGKYNTEYPQKVTTTLQKGVEQGLKGDQAAADKASSDATALTDEWTTKLRAQATHTDNAGLRAAIDDLASRLEPLETGAASLNDMKQIVADANTAIAQSCPQGTHPAGSTSPHATVTP